MRVCEGEKASAFLLKVRGHGCMEGLHCCIVGTVWIALIKFGQYCYYQND